MNRPIKRLVSVSVAAILTVFSLPGIALAEEQQYPLGYDFYDSLQGFREGKAMENCQSLSVVSEGGKSFARLQALAGTTFAKRTSCTYTPDAKLILKKPYVLGKNTKTLISAKFRTNYIEYFHKALAVNYEDNDNNQRYTKHWDTLLTETNGKFREFSDWSLDEPVGTTILEGVAPNKWYTENCYIETDNTGAATAMSFEIIDCESGKSLVKTEKRELNEGHTLKSMTEISSLGFEMYTFPDPPENTLTNKKNSVSVTADEWSQITGIIITGDKDTTTGYIPVYWPKDTTSYAYYIGDIYFSKLTISDVSVNIPEKIVIPLDGSVEEKIEIKSVKNQLGTTEGINNTLYVQRV